MSIEKWIEEAKIKYTKPSRDDGFWDAAPSSDNDGIEIYKKRGNGSLRPICEIQEPDLDENGECGGNMALICASPAMYECLLGIRGILKILMRRQKTTEAEKFEYKSQLIEINKIVHTIESGSKMVRVEVNSEYD